MELGTTIPTYSTGDHLASAETLREWARRAEDAGLAGLWLTDHLLEPRTYRTATLDPLVTLSHAAAVTDRIELGTAVLILPFRRTATVARAVRSLQHLAGRPVTLGVGTGYIPAEFEAAGVPRAERGRRTTEGVAVLRRLFSGEAVSFDGEFHSFEDVRLDPVLEDAPRILVGGGWVEDDDGEPTIPDPVLDRILMADGWIGAIAHPEEAATAWDLIAEHARDRGVDPDSIDRLLISYAHLVDGDDPDRVREEQRDAFAELWPPAVRPFEEFVSKTAIVGTIEEIQAMLDGYREAGFDQVVIAPAARDPGARDRHLDLLIDRLLPHVS